MKERSTLLSFLSIYSLPTPDLYYTYTSTLPFLVTMGTERDEQDAPLLTNKGGFRPLSSLSVDNSQSTNTASSSSVENSGLDNTSKHEEESFGTWTGVAFTVNYIMGCGFLGIPFAFTSSVSFVKCYI